MILKEKKQNRTKSLEYHLEDNEYESHQFYLILNVPFLAELYWRPTRNAQLLVCGKSWIRNSHCLPGTTNVYGETTFSGFFVSYYIMYVQTSGEELANFRKNFEDW